MLMKPSSNPTAFLVASPCRSASGLRSGVTISAIGRQSCTKRFSFPTARICLNGLRFPTRRTGFGCTAFRTELWSRSAFGGGTYRSTGRPWFDYHQFPKDRARTLLSITFAFVATHNQFVFDRGGKVFNRSAPVIKLPQDATEGAHLALLGVLNSSTACFWMKQVFQDKGGGGIGGGISAEAWETAALSTTAPS